MAADDGLKGIDGRWTRASRWVGASAWATVLVCAPAVAEPRLAETPPDASRHAEPIVMAVASIAGAPTEGAAPSVSSATAATATAATPPSTPAATADAPRADPAVPRSTYALPTDWRARAALDLKRPAQAPSLGLSIVELPPEGVPNGRTRPRHALSMSSDTPRRMLRSMGIEASDCATRFRMPTKLRRDAEGGSSIEVRATLGLACNF